MRNIKLVVEYDGTNYVGWQRQENGQSIQGVLESALKQMLQREVNIIGAGRTDSGVHARGQVANFRTESELGVEEIKRGLNGLLPDDIVVHGAEEASLDFHARYSAKERTYCYAITRIPSAMLRLYSWHVPYRLNVDLMQEAASAVVGTHDFESFCKAESEVQHHRCSVLASCWHEEGSTLRYIVSADRFLHGMVRTLVGTMVDVGRGYTAVDEFMNILGRKNRSEAGMSAPAKGLVLEKVLY